MISKILVVERRCLNRAGLAILPPASGGRLPAPRARGAVLAFCAAATVAELSAVSLAHADCPAIGASASTSTDFDGTIQTQSACGTFSAIPNVSFVDDPDNGGSATSRAQASGDPGISLSLGAYAFSSGVALSASAGASFSDTIALDVGQTAALEDYGKAVENQDGIKLNFAPIGSITPLANLLSTRTYSVTVDVDVDGYAVGMTGSTLDLSFDGVTDFASFSNGKWSAVAGNISVPDGAAGLFSFTFDYVSPPTPSDPADFTLSINVTAGSDGNTVGKIDFFDPVTIGGITVEDDLGNIVPSVEVVSGSGLYYPVTDGLIAPSAPEPSTWVMVLLGLAGLGYAGSRTRRAAAA